MPILYSFQRCPYAMRARMALIVSGTATEIREVSLKQKPAAMLAASPKATVPVLVQPSGDVIDESLDIMHWALGRNDPEDWLGGDDKSLIAENDTLFKPHLDRYKYGSRFDADPLHHRGQGLAWLEGLDKRLAAQANLCRHRRALTDIAVFPFVRQFAATDPAWFAAQPLPNLHRWLTCHISSKLFEAAMTRLTPWQPGAPPVMFMARQEI